MSDRDDSNDNDEIRTARALGLPEYQGAVPDRFVSGENEGVPDDGGDTDLKHAPWSASSMWDILPLKLPPYLNGVVLKGVPFGPGANYSPNKYPTGGLFPLVRADASYAPTISVFNNSAYSISFAYQLRLPSGGLSATHTKTLAPFAVDRYTPTNFEGSVTVVGHGEAFALQCVLEVRATTGKAVAIAEPAGSAGYVWHYMLGVRDNGPGQDRCTIATYNFDDRGPIYVEYGLGFRECILTYTVKGKKKVTEKKWVAGTRFEVKIPPLGMYSFRPYDKANEALDDRVYVAATTGPNSSGKQVRYFTSAHFFEGTDDIAFHNYKSPHRCYVLAPKLEGYKDWFRMYFVDVADDGVARADRIHLKVNKSASKTPYSFNFKLHFYNPNGTPVGAPVSIKIEGNFGAPDSYRVISPKDLLGKSFKGSIGVEGAEADNLVGWVEGRITREAPGKWRDLSDYAPPGRPDHINCIPYVADIEQDWRYRIALFYPEPGLAAAPPAPKDKPPPFSGPSVTIPTKPGGGWVFLAFYDMKGKYRGTYALEMSTNETAIVSFDGDLGKYLKDFQGAVVISPGTVIAQYQIASAGGDAFGSTGNWLTMD